MEQYIPKSVVVAEIKKRFDEYSTSILKHYDACKEAKAQELGKILIILDTLEVKEVDLKKEFSQWWKGERVKDYNVDILYERYSNVLIKLAKYFFELGMLISNKVQKVE